MTGAAGRSLQLSGSITLDAAKLAERVAELVLPGLPERVADLVLARLEERGIGIQLPAGGEPTSEDRNSPFIPPSEMPPRGAVEFGFFDRPEDTQP